MGSIRGRVRLTVALIVLVAAPASSLALARDLSFDERVNAQKAIEQIYWNHRIWPKENPGPKPPLSAVMSDAAIRAKINDDLRMSALLEAYWHQPLTGERLQAEIERMARQTRAPETLHELFTALHDDPLLIAECLARPTLTRRLVASAFAEDERIHGAQRGTLVRKLVGVDDVATLERLDGAHAEVTYVLDDGAVSKDRPADPEHRAIRLSRSEWNRELGRLAESFGPAPVIAMPMLPVGRVSRLVDRGNRFVVLAIRARDATSVTVASVSWMKRAYGDWAREATGSVELGGRAIAPPVAGYSVPALPLGDCADDTWEPTAGSNVPEARSGHTAIWTGSEMVVWGGGTTTGGRYNPSTDSWVATSAGANVPVGCSYHTALWTGSEMIVWGGVCGAAALSTGGRYNPVTDTWAASSLATGSGANVPPARGGHTAVWTGSEMIVWGGFDTVGPAILNTGGRYNPVTDTWAASSLTTGSGANVPPASFAHEAVWTGSEMIVWGGINYVTGYLNTGGRYDPVTDTWTASSLTAGSGTNVPEARYRHTAVWTGSEMIVWGGYGLAPGVFGWKTGGRYNPSTDTWVTSSLTTGSGANVPAARYDHTCVWTGSEMIVWGGTGEFVSLKTGGRYNPVSDTWVLSSLTDGAGPNVPPASGNHTAVWTGTEMIVWGGYFAYASNASSTGGRYNPATDTWAASSLTTVAPPVSGGHTTVWTGSEMLVRGVSGGGRYDPSTDVWVASSLSANSDSRYRHTAVWTGTEMIVWGGLDPDSGQLSTGEIYDPFSDASVPSSLTTGSGANVPAARESHTAVWTGSEMIVWGGYNSDQGYLHNGGRYKPSTDSWAVSSLTTGSGANVPGNRYQHSALWTGTAMIVWGGNSGGTVDLRTGGRYDPSSDTWAASSLTTGSGANCPSARDSHTAVWTGNEMIVWGGYTHDAGGHYLNNGGRYDPSTDTWASSSLTTGSGANVPTAQLIRTAIWSGSEMIVWGGGSNTGGRYDPSTDAWALSSLTAGTGANVPAARSGHSAVWTGSSDHRMIVWGGDSGTRTGGLYCAQVSCASQTWYRDADADGHGNPAVTQSDCVQPPGYVATTDDCNDANPAIYPGALEVCDGLDNDCDTVSDNGGDALCDDANFCTEDSCNHSGGCAHVVDPASCNDDNVCTADVCVPSIGCPPIHKTANIDTTDFSSTRVDGLDLVVLAAAWNSCPTDPVPTRYNPDADLDPLNPCVEDGDFHQFMNAFGRGCP